MRRHSRSFGRLATLVVTALVMQQLSIGTGHAEAPDPVNADAAAASIPILPAQWTLADGRSNVADVVGDPVSVTDQAILTSENDVSFGLAYSRHNTDAPDLVRTAVIGDRVSWLIEDTTTTVVTERLDGTDRQSYSTTAHVAAFVPDGWIELSWRDDALVADRVTASDGDIGASSELGVLYRSATAERPQPTTTSLTTSDIAAFTVTLSGAGTIKIPLRFFFGSGQLEVLAASDETHWRVVDANQGAVLLYDEGSVGGSPRLREIGSDGTTVAWEPAETAGGDPQYLGRAPVWSSASGWTEGAPDGTVIDLGPWPLAGEPSVSVGDRVFWHDRYSGLVNSDREGNNTTVLDWGGRLSDLTIDAVSMSRGTVAWSDNYRLEFGFGDRANVSQRKLTSSAPDIRSELTSDSDPGVLDRYGPDTYVMKQKSLVRFSDESGEQVVSELPAVPRHIEAAAGEILLQYDDNSAALVDSATGAVTPTAADTISDDWRARVDRTDPDGRDRLMLQSTASDLEEEIANGGPSTFDAPRLMGNVVFWIVEQDAAEPEARPIELQWVDLFDPDRTVNVVPVKDFSQVEVVAGDSQWFALAGSDNSGQPLAQLYRLGVRAPQAVLRGFSYEQRQRPQVTLDDEFVAWVVDGVNGDRLVGSELPDHLGTGGVPAMTAPPAEAPAEVPTLQPAWTVADSRSNRSDFVGYPNTVTPDAILTSENDVYYGPGFENVNTDVPDYATAAVLGGRVSYVPSMEPVVITTELFDGSDEQTYEPSANFAAFTPDGWLEVARSDATVVLYRVVAAGGAMVSRTELGVVHTTTADDSRGATASWNVYSDQAALFTVTLPGPTTTQIPIRYLFDTATFDILAPPDEVVDGVGTFWTTTGINGTDAILTSDVQAPTQRFARWVSESGAAATWPATGKFLGRQVVLKTDTGYAVGNVDGSTTDVGPALPLFDEPTYSGGEEVFWTDYRLGLVRSTWTGEQRQMVLSGTGTAPLSVGSLSASQGALAWTDDSDLTDDALGPRAAAHRVVMTPAGPTDRVRIDADVDPDIVDQVGTDTYVSDRGTADAVVRAVTQIDAVGSARRLLDLTAPPRWIEASDTSVLVAPDISYPVLVDLASGAASDSLAQTVSDNWLARVDQSQPDENDHIVVTSTRDGSQREVSVSYEFTVSSLHLMGDVLVWQVDHGWWEIVSGPKYLRWIDLSDPLGVVHSVLVSASGGAEIVAGDAGWFVLRSLDEQRNMTAHLYQVGVPTPRATLAGYVMTYANEDRIALDDGYVSWVVAGPEGDRIVAAPLPALIEPPASAGMFRLVDQVRLADSRTPYGIPGRLAAGTQATLKMTTGYVVPYTGVSAVSLNVVATGAVGSGYLSVHPTGSDDPPVSTLNFTDGDTVSNEAIVPVGADGSVTFEVGGSGSADVVVDLLGYFVAGEVRAPGGFVPLAPARVVDSRDELGLSQPLGALRTAELSLLGKGGLPTSGVSAIVATVTAVDPTDDGNLGLYPGGGERPLVSNINFVRGESRANLVTVPVGPDGTIEVYNFSWGSTQLVVDVAGYYLAGTPTAPGAFVPITPKRVVDSRSSHGVAKAIGAMSWLEPEVAGLAVGIPLSGVSAVVGNLTVTQPTSDGNLGTDAKPSNYWLSSINFAAGQTVAGHLVTGVSPDGTLAVRNDSFGSTHVIVDVTGYYLGN